MPKVELYGPARVAPRPISGGQITVVPGPDTFGAQLGDTAERLGVGLLTEEWTRERNQADQVAHLQAVNQLDEATNTLLYDPQKGALGVKGKATLDLENQVMPQFDSTASNLQAGLANDRQKLAFQASVLRRRQELDLQLKRHTAQSMLEYDNDESATATKNAVGRAIADPTNPIAIADGLQTAEAVVTDHAKRAGWGPEATAAALGDVRTQTHVGVIESLLAQGQDQLATTYFQETKDQIDGAHLPAVERALEIGSTLGASQRQADTIMGSTTSEADALKAAAQITDPKIRANTEELLHRNWAWKDQEHNKAIQQLMIDAGNKIDKNPRLGIRAVSPTVLAQLSPAEKSSLEAYAKRNAPGEDAIKTDWGLWYGLMSEAQTNPAKFDQENMMLYRARLGNTEFKQLTELKGREHAPSLDDFRTADEILRDQLGSAGIDPTDKKNKQLIGQFHNLVAEQVRTQQSVTGKKATKDDIEKISADVISRHYLSPPTFWQSVFGSPGTAKRVLQATIDDVPPAVRTQIEQALTADHVPISDENILYRFKLWKLKGAQP